MNQSTVELLFPTPILRSNIGRDFTDQEMNTVIEHSKATYRNRGNTTSSNTYILEEEKFAGLKEICLSKVKEYIDIVHKPRYAVNPCFTQSWLNWTCQGEYHHEHAHPNSFISGVLYINAGEEDKIKFFKGVYQQIKLDTDQYDIYNSDSWWFGVKTGDIVLFPSNTLHSVEAVTEADPRISLAFNTFLTGTLGEKKELTEMKI